jgi:hypothetical protein
VIVVERLLHGMERITFVGETFDRYDAATICLHCQHRATLDRLAINMDRAGTALAGITTHMRAGQPQVVTQGMNQQRVVGQVEGPNLSVHLQRDFRHRVASPEL